MGEFDLVFDIHRHEYVSLLQCTLFFTWFLKYNDHDTFTSLQNDTCFYYTDGPVEGMRGRLLI